MLKIYSKLSKFPVSFARWQIDHGEEKKYIAFSEDEKSLILVTKQGDYYQYELVKKYTLVTKVLWHSLRNQMVLEKDIMDKLRTNAMSFAYVNYLHSDDLGEQW